MRAALLALTLLPLVSCTYPEDPELSQHVSAIVNGSTDPGHPEVGVLYLQARPGCTATLVGSRTVLTAAHCVTHDSQPPYRLASPISFKVGGKMYMASSAVMHPAYGHGGCGWVADVALVRLAQPVQGITPARVARGAPHEGETVTLVGFGYTSDSASSSFGVKRRATNTIGKLTQNLISFYGATGSMGNICFGDSGGPAFAVRGGVEYLVGVHSFGEGACGVTEHDQRADFYRPWIEQQATGDLHPDTGTADLPQQPVTLEYSADVDGSELVGGCSVSGSAPAPSAWLVLLALLALRRCLRGGSVSPWP